MLWGIINGFCNICEKLLADKKLYKKTPVFIKWALTTAVTFFCWQIFSFTDFSACKECFAVMFGIKKFASVPYTWQYYFDARILFLASVGIIGSTIFGLPKIRSIYTKAVNTKTGYIINNIVFAILFIIAIIFMINSKYSPFIYFQY